MNKQKLLSTLVVVTLVFGLSFKVIGDSDFGWHLRAGQYIVETKSIPKTDIFSFSEPNYPYIFQSWAAEALIYMSYKPLGLWGTSAFYALILTIFVFLIKRIVTLVAKSQPTPLFLLFLTPIAYALAGGRTRVFGLLFLACLYFIFLKLERQFFKLLVLTIIIFALWANFHASFILGIFILAILAIQNYLQYRNKKIFLLIPASLAATLANPYFLNAPKQAIQMSLNSSAIKAINPDWQPLTTSYSTGWIFALMVAAALGLIAIFKIKTNKNNLFLLIILFLLSVFLSSRFSIALLIFSAPLAQETLKFFKNKLIKQILGSPPVRISLTALIATLILLVTENILEINYSYKSLGNYSQFLKTHSPKRLAVSSWPYRANAYVEKNLKGKRILNEANWGGFMLLVNKDRKVFYYGAMDNYIINGKSFAFEYLSIVNAEPGFETKLEKYKIDSIFLPPSYPLVVKLERNNNWEVVYKDSQAQIIKRKVD